MLSDAELVITCEGRLDNQTPFGKAPAAVARLAQSLDVPCIAIAGNVDDAENAVSEIGFSAVFGLCRDATDIEASMKHAAARLRDTTQQAVHHWFFNSPSPPSP